MEPDERRPPDHHTRPSPLGPSEHASDVTAPPAASLQSLQDGAASAAGVPVEMDDSPDVILPVTWNLAPLSSLPLGDRDTPRVFSGEPAIATIVSASGVAVTAGAPAPTTFSSGRHGDHATAPGYLILLYGDEPGSSASPTGNSSAEAPCSSASPTGNSSAEVPASPPPPPPTYLYLFYGDEAEDGTVTTIGFDSTARLIIHPESHVPGGMPVGEFAGSLSQILAALASHIDAAIESTRAGIPVSPAAQDGQTEQMPGNCQLCAHRASSCFVPCCRTMLCDDCGRLSPPQCNCGIGVLPVPFPPRFRTRDGQPVPQTFVRLLWPQWQIYRYVAGPSFVMVSFYDTASAYHRPELGVRIQTHIYRREGEAGWAWRVEFHAVIPPVDPLHIHWQVVLAPHYASG